MSTQEGHSESRLSVGCLVLHLLFAEDCLKCVIPSVASVSTWFSHVPLFACIARREET